MRRPARALFALCVASTLTAFAAYAAARPPYRGADVQRDNSRAHRAAPAADRIEVAADLTTKNVRTQECNLADLIADAVRDSAGTDCAFLTASSFEEITIGKGPAATEDFLKALVFKDLNVLVVKLTGAQVKKALAHGLALYPQRHSAFLQVSGLSATIDPRADKDKRVVSVRIAGRDVDDKKSYTVAMPATLANGGLMYLDVWPKSAIDHDTDKSLEDAVTSYLSGKRTIAAPGGDRLVFKS